MRIALISDIHSNILALEAIFRDIHKRGADCILSLGDQVNLGPCPRETLALLQSEGACCLHGNHERYILSAMRGDPEYDGANFRSLHFNAEKLRPEEITFPQTLQMEGVTFCHAMPGDDRFPVNEPSLALPRLRDMLGTVPAHVICGHGHNPISYRLPGFTLDGIGSAGCMDDGLPGMTLYTLADISKGAVCLHPVYVAWDTSPIKALFKSGGMADYCPVMAHIACLQMQHNHDYLVEFVTCARALSKARGETQMSMNTLWDADGLFAWPDGIATAQFWKSI